MLVVAAAIAAAASAQLPDQANPYQDFGEDLSRTTGVGADTDHTPRAKEDDELWQLVSGARFGWDERDGPQRNGVIPGSSTTFHTSLYAVSFANLDNGLAGGSERVDCDGDGERETDVPVLHQYWAARSDIEPGWHEVPRAQIASGCERPGYVGAIAWITDEKALAVGGTGRFLEREPAYDPAGQDLSKGEPYGLKSDPAGKARAWLYEDERWRELEDLPEGMRGMGALDCDPNSASDYERCVAGALGQTWLWERQSESERGRFTAGADTGNVPGAGQAPIRFRVRSVHFVPHLSKFTVQVFAVTSGCCAENPLRNFPRLLAGDGRSWSMVGPGGDDPAERGPYAQTWARELNVRQDMPDSLYSVTARPFGLSSSPQAFRVSVIATPGGPEDPNLERPSIVSQPSCKNPHGHPAESGFGGTDRLVFPPLDPLFTALRTNLSSARLLAGDGDVSFSFGGNFGLSALGFAQVGRLHARSSNPREYVLITCGTGIDNPPVRRADEVDRSDGVPDWVVGELRSTDRGLGARGLALSTTLNTGLIGDVVTNPFLWGGPSNEDLAGAPGDPERPLRGLTSKERIAAYLKSSYFLLPSYSAHAIDVIDPHGEAWAVGEHGGIVQLSQRALAKRQVEPPPPSLGRHRPAGLPERAPYDEHRPAPAGGALGALPRYGGGGAERLPHPRLSSGGSPDPSHLGTTDPEEDVARAVMSRDGSEGWALGAASGEWTTLHHYDGSSWSRCDTSGVRGQLDSDPACAALKPLRENLRFDAPNQRWRPAPRRIIAATRVPLEHDSDLSNDDEFELLATADAYIGPDDSVPKVGVLRYRDGRWAIAPESSDRQLRELLKVGGIGNNDGVVWAQGASELALAAPDDGWLLDAGGLLRLDDTGWRRCQPLSDCGAGALAGVDLGGARLVSAGPRTYLYGRRGEHPAILYRDPGAGEVWRADPEEGGHDPGAEPTPDPAKQGRISSLAIARHPDGILEGWATGRFGAGSEEAPLLRIEPGGRWLKFHDQGAFRPGVGPNLDSSAVRSLVVPGAGGPSRAFVAAGATLYVFDPARGRFEPVEAQPQASGRWGAQVQALVPDGHGGAWAAVSSAGRASGLIQSGWVHFLRYTDRPPETVFEEVSNPTRDPEESLTALAASPEGTLWAATGSDVVYRYDRLTGWDRVRIPGWEPRAATVRHAAHALALRPDGDGVLVGAGGRIARIESGAVALDQAAGEGCDPAAPQPPCSTGRDLRAVAVAPDGSALAGGDRLGLVWRPADGQFRTTTPENVAGNATITGISFPLPGRAWLATSTGAIVAGELQGDGSWAWRRENVTPSGASVPSDALRRPIPLRAIALDPQGRGYAVGDRGAIVRRTGSPGEPWQRVKSRFLDDLTAVTLAPDGGERALVGGHNGLVLAGEGERFWLARPADYFNDNSHSRSSFTQWTGPVIGLALLPGVRPGQVEAWAATRADDSVRQHGRIGAIAQLFHYASDPREPLLNPEGRAPRPLPDAPPPRVAELSLVAFGNSAGPLDRSRISRPEVLLARTLDEIAARARRAGGPELALFTGDALAGSRGGPNVGSASAGHRAWAETVAEPLADAGLPLYAALGRRDLSELPGLCPADVAGVCDGTTGHARRLTKLGENYAWRKAMADRPRPWGAGKAPERGSLAFRPVRDRRLATRAENVGAQGPDGSRPLAELTGGAATHYALDVVERSGERELARLVFVDNSNRSLAASDPFQQPLEPEGGQAAWLEAVLCRRGHRTSTGERCTRGPDQPAIVVATTPTYAYGPTERDELASDATAFEALLMKHDVSLVVSGRLGWNGRYWASAPGVHEPCPGEAYRESPPQPGTRACGHGASELPGAERADELATATGVSEALRGLPPPPAAAREATGTLDGEGVLPFVVASTAAGPFGASGVNARAQNGFWNGYTVVRLPASGDPRALIVEQRPLLDHVRIDAASHVMRPGQRMTLRGIGREPAGLVPFGPGANPRMDARFNEIENAAITHRYDLVEADPERPYLPRLSADGDYLPLDPRIATVEGQSGRIRTGRGNHPRTFALGLLSVGERVVTWPVVFESRRAFRPKPPQLVAPLPAPKALSAAAASIQSPQAPPPVNPPTPQVNLPVPPVIPSLPTPTASPPAPPAPPAPPPPPVSPQATPLDLVTSPVGLNVAPQATVIPPPAPPIQPAPPSGARREARQRQAATQKSGADMGEGSQIQELGGDLAEGPHGPGQAFARRERVRAEGGSFTVVRHADQPSAWARGAVYGGGLTLLALALAAGWTVARSKPKRRPPAVPSPAWARYRRR